MPEEMAYLLLITSQTSHRFQDDRLANFLTPVRYPLLGWWISHPPSLPHICRFNCQMPDLVCALAISRRAISPQLNLQSPIGYRQTVAHQTILQGIYAATTAKMLHTNQIRTYNGIMYTWRARDMVGKIKYGYKNRQSKFTNLLNPITKFADKPSDPRVNEYQMTGILPVLQTQGNLLNTTSARIWTGLTVYKGGASKFMLLKGGDGYLSSAVRVSSRRWLFADGGVLQLMIHTSRRWEAFRKALSG